jgi:hypothetical protein
MFALSSLGTWHSFSFLYFLDDLFTSNLHISIWSCPSWVLATNVMTSMLTLCIEVIKSLLRHQLA